MSARCPVLGVLAALCLVFCSGCALGVNRRPSSAGAGSVMSWLSTPVQSTLGAQGETLEAVSVRSGEVLRIEVPSSSPVELGELQPTRGHAIESWLRYSPEAGVVYLRASLLASAVIARPGTMLRVARGRAKDPGYGWFALEAQALSWAERPLKTPFPELARGERVDATRFAELDDALQRALTTSPNLARDRAASLAVRRVMALRAVRELRPLEGLPYFYFSEPVVMGQARARLDASSGRPSYEVTPQAPLLLALEGPSVFELLGSVGGNPSDETTLRVMEGERERGKVTLAATSSRSAANGASSGGERRRLPRMRLHVPPGHHEYAILASRDAEIRTLTARAAVHFEDARVKSEEAMLNIAEQTCDLPANPGLCLLALALLGRDGPSPKQAATKPSGALDYASALGQSDARARAIADAVSRGVSLASADTDAASARSSLRNSEWSVVPGESDESWSASFSEAGNPACSNDDPPEPPLELTASSLELGTSTWHGAPALELIVATSCDDSDPIELEVDGQRLRATPTSNFVRWHIRTRGPTSRVSRLDHGGARVYPARTQQGPCSQRWAKLRAPSSAASSPRLGFGGSTGAPGVEIWLRNGARNAELRVRPLTGTSPNEELRLVVASGTGLAALDARGARWTRVAKVPLPAHWAAGGVSITGPADLAVRALVRSAKPANEAIDTQAAAEEAVAAEPDSATLTGLSAQLLRTPANERGSLYLERALLLARSGAARGALSDARAAEALGAQGSAGEPAAELVRAAIRFRPTTPSSLPVGVAAFGVEPDFDASAARCGGSAGPRTTFEHVWQELQNRQPATEPHFDTELAARALTAAALNSSDPRANTLQSRALAGSRYRELSSAASTLPRRRYDEDARQLAAGAIDAWGELRPGVASGGLLQAGTFVVADADRPARARLTGLPRNAKLRLELLCYAKEPAVSEACSPTISFEGKPAGPSRLQQVVETVTLNTTRAGSSELLLAPTRSPARWTLLARIVLDRPVPGAEQVAGIGWVLAPKPHEYRFELAAGRAFTLDAVTTRVIRLQAHAAAEAELVAEFAGSNRPVPGDGTPLVLVLPAGSSLQVHVTRGTASLTVAERVAADTTEHSVIEAVSRSRQLSPPRAAPTPASAKLRFDQFGDETPLWRRDAALSPAPLSALEDSLGTAIAASGAVLSNVRNRGTPGAGSSSYAFTKLGYRRRVESIGLTTAAAAFSRLRPGEPTFGTEGSLYWDLARAHTRLSSSGSYETQRVLGVPSRAFRLRGFAEYSYRAASNLFILPRLGWDTVDVSLAFRPSSLVEVDDDIYDPYRGRRPTFIFAQALFWYTPHFNDIFYLRLRATEDAHAGAFSHAALRPGAFTVLGNLDLAANVDVTWYAATDSRSGVANSQETLSLSATYDLWFDVGSLDIAPNLAGQLRPSDGAFQVSASITVLGSFRRGLRDFSSLELDFPEQRSDGVPWRGPNRSAP